MGTGQGQGFCTLDFGLALTLLVLGVDPNIVYNFLSTLDNVSEK